MVATFPPRSIILFGGNAAGRVLSGRRAAVGQSFAIWVADRRRGASCGDQVGSASGANDPLPTTHQEMAENRGFRAMVARAVAGSAVAGSAKGTDFRASAPHRRLIANLHNAARSTIEAAQLGRRIDAFPMGGAPLSNATPNPCPSRMTRLGYGKSAGRRPAFHCKPDAGAGKLRPGLMGSGVRGFAYPKKTALALTGARRKSAAFGRTGCGVAARLGVQGAGVHGVVDPVRAAQSAWVARGRNHVNAA
jgi:hypothetical protein